MTTREETRAPPGSGVPAGGKPKTRPEREDARLRDEAKRDSSGDAPIDPADEGFIESNRT